MLNIVHWHTVLGFCAFFVAFNNILQRYAVGIFFKIAGHYIPKLLVYKGYYSFVVALCAKVNITQHAYIKRVYNILKGNVAVLFFFFLSAVRAFLSSYQCGGA